MTMLIPQVNSLMNCIRRWMEACRKAGEQQRTMRELEALDDHILRDIGLSRDQLLRMKGGGAPVPERRKAGQCGNTRGAAGAGRSVPACSCRAAHEAGIALCRDE
ncbi:DUF1127 domain-containing protein [Desulfovibrio subterraneus]|uniref:YjiS-like domain-containing protein n=1 Tax=Desulfovibrio subterraneus TaxID=2718620 RepID=A0A7J0BGE2_9BACT|nr:DUF1127 domain-containing protein [Desulfovibrio subterraneus]GFM32779.1 hypothetical protein DSM101010T_11440 [Desulfovibrio subterraneus]